MSSILKALKKIEGRKVDTSLPSWPYGAGNLESMDRHIHRSRQRQKILGLLIILCAVALAGKFYIGSRPVSEKTDPQSTVSQGPPPSAGHAVNPAEVAEPETRNPVDAASESPPAPAPSPRELSSETAAPSAPSASPAQEAASETEAPKVISPPPAAPSETAATEKTEPAPLMETFAAPPADNAGLSLMALVWSSRPESRFVVINGTITREGGSIEGSTVVRIEADYVVMRTGGVTWKLK